MSENLNEHVVVAFFESPEQADAAAEALMSWDHANDDIKLGTIGRLTHSDEGKVEVKDYGRSRSRRGALIGGAIGLVAAGLTGGLSLLVGTLGGGAIGGVTGKVTADHLDLTGESLRKIEEQLTPGRAALVVLCDDLEVDPTMTELQKAGGEAHSFGVSAKVLQAIHEAEVNRRRDESQMKNLDRGMT